MVHKRKCESPARNTRSSKSSRRADDVSVNDPEGTDGGGSTPTTPNDLRAVVVGEQAVGGGVETAQSTEEAASNDKNTAPRDSALADRDSTPMAHADPVVSVEVALPSESVPDAVESAKAVDDVHHNNAYSSLFPTKKKVLQGALAVTSSKYDGAYQFSGVVTANAIQIHCKKDAARLLACAAHADSVAIKAPMGGIVNMSLADPSMFSFNDKGYLWSKTTNSWVLTSLTGLSTYYSTSNIRQICVMPFAHGWLRFAAVLAEMSGVRSVFVPSFQGGISFAVSRFPGVGIATPTVAKGVLSAPIAGSLIPRDQDIPVYDGRHGFQLGKYWERPYESNIPKGSTVMVLFSLRKGALAATIQGLRHLPKDISFAFYPNILAIIVLADPVDRPPFDPFLAPPATFGVNEILEYKEPEIAEPEEKADDAEVTGIELDEEFL